MGVVDHGIFAIGHLGRYVKENLISVCFKKELGKAKHPVAWRWPLTALRGHNSLLGWSEIIKAREVVGERMLLSELHRTTLEHKPPRDSQKFAIGRRQLKPDRGFDLADLVFARTGQDVLNRIALASIDGFREPREIFAKAVEHVGLPQKAQLPAATGAGVQPTTQLSIAGVGGQLQPVVSEHSRSLGRAFP